MPGIDQSSDGHDDGLIFLISADETSSFIYPLLHFQFCQYNKIKPFSESNMDAPDHELDPHCDVILIWQKSDDATAGELRIIIS